MDLQFARLVGDLLLPPGNIILLLLLSLLLRKYFARLAQALLALGLTLLLLLSMPLVADGLCRHLESNYPPLLRERVVDLPADAIVVLAGGWRRAPEYGEDTVNVFSLQRLTYGVWLHRRSGLPLALSGGRVTGRARAAEAEMMARVLRQDFALQPRWVETGSRNTAENARNTVALLKQSGVQRIVLVTNAFHMARAVPEFEAQGVEVIPAPMGFLAGPEYRFRPHLLFPSASALRRSYLGLHESLGRAWYRLRYGA